MIILQLIVLFACVYVGGAELFTACILIGLTTHLLLGWLALICVLAVVWLLFLFLTLLLFKYVL